jgi:hypothetical protein
MFQVVQGRERFSHTAPPWMISTDEFEEAVELEELLDEELD